MAFPLQVVLWERSIDGLAGLEKFAQCWRWAPRWKLCLLPHAGLEVVVDFDGDTFRAVYTVRFAEAVYVLHAFQKKSKRGIATPKADLALIDRRLKLAREDYERWSGSEKNGSR